MPVPSSRIGLRGLAVALFLLAGGIALLDPIRADSLLASLWEGRVGPRSFWPGFLEDLERRWPRWNR